MIEKQDLNLMNKVAQAIFDKKGFNIFAIDVRAFSSMADFFILAEGSVEKHVLGLANYIQEVTKNFDISPLHTEGMSTGEWVVLDFGSLVVHLMIPEIREKYALEELWKEGEIVELTIEVGERSYG